MLQSDRVTCAGKLIITIMRRCKFYAYVVSSVVWDETRSEIPSSIIIRSLCNLPKACGPKILYCPHVFRNAAFSINRVWTRTFPKPRVPRTFLILLYVHTERTANRSRYRLVRVSCMYGRVVFSSYPSRRDVLRPYDFTHGKSRYNAIAPSKSMMKTRHVFRAKRITI